MASDEIVLKMCKICGRTFNPNSLERHERICETGQKTTKRTVFKSFMQRSREMDLVPVHKKEEFGKCSAKRESKSSGLLNNGQSPVKSVPYGYQPCPFCGRHFNQKAADRHISWCKEQKSRLPKTPQNSVALERLQARVNYQAPRPKARNLNNNMRLVKSAESIRDTACFHAQFTASLRQHRPIEEYSPKQGLCKNQEKILEKNSRLLTRSTSSLRQHRPTEEYSPKQSLCKNQENTLQKNLEMLKTLKLHLSQLSTSEEHFSQYTSKSNLFQKHVTAEVIQENCCYNKSSDQPRFCYNCGTKYPIANAKFCCECGTQRLMFKVDNQSNFECL